MSAIRCSMRRALVMRLSSWVLTRAMTCCAKRSDYWVRLRSWLRSVVGGRASCDRSSLRTPRR
eukprot:5953522-Lingulodinium_polyedra.AAC.1